MAAGTVIAGRCLRRPRALGLRDRGSRRRPRALGLRDRGSRRRPRALGLRDRGSRRRQPRLVGTLAVVNRDRPSPLPRVRWRSTRRYRARHRSPARHDCPDLDEQASIDLRWNGRIGRAPTMAFTSRNSRGPPFAVFEAAEGHRRQGRSRPYGYALIHRLRRSRSSPPITAIDGRAGPQSAAQGWVNGVPAS
jgi:hypothetical protein